MRPEIQVFPTGEVLARAAATEVVTLATEAVKARGRFTLALAGGSTPKALYALLAGDAHFRDAMPWGQTHFFWGDERHVPPGHADSNYRMANEAMLAKVPVPAAQMHRIRAEEADAAQAAMAYEQTLREVFVGETIPRFDAILLGMGTDGHTASLFPGTAALGETRRLVAANWVPKFSTWRITFTAPLLNHASNVIFLVNGPDKAEPLQAVLEGPRQPEVLPSQLVQPVDGRLVWMLDATAAERLNRVP